MQKIAIIYFLGPEKIHLVLFALRALHIWEMALIFHHYLGKFGLNNWPPFINHQIFNSKEFSPNWIVCHQMLIFMKYQNIESIFNSKSCCKWEVTSIKMEWKNWKFSSIVLVVQWRPSGKFSNIKPSHTSDYIFYFYC